MIRVCFVCLGNICRSPTAEGVMIALVEEANLARSIEVDSAGTAAYHVGERPDPRSLKAAKAHAVHLPSVARQFDHTDFARFDYVLAMDRTNRANLLSLARNEAERGKVALLRSFDPRSVEQGELDVPDPYYGGPEGFEAVFQICHAACAGLLAHLRNEHGL